MLVPEARALGAIRNGVGNVGGGNQDIGITRRKRQCTTTAIISFSNGKLAHKVSGKIGDIEPFRRAIRSERATLLDERLPIYWVGWNMVRATLHLLRWAHQEGTSDYY